jgi:hypothetical protein
MFAIVSNAENALSSRRFVFRYPLDTKVDYVKRAVGIPPRENIEGTPLVIYWSFEAPTADLTNGNIGIDHVIDVTTHFFNKTRWARTFRLIRGYPFQ